MRERTRDDVLREAGIEFPIRNENTLAARILELETALADAQREKDAMAAVVEQACRWDNASTTGDDYLEHDALADEIHAYRARAKEGA